VYRNGALARDYAHFIGSLAQQGFGFDDANAFLLADSILMGWEQQY
jgi:hypothetical protein